MKMGGLKQNKSKRKKREFVGVIYKCCNVYSRIYINKKRTAFVGWCPKCGARMEFIISPKGSKSKFFEVI
jgi:hypothetical protein